MAAAHDALVSAGSVRVDGDRIAALGYCLGGRLVLDYARGDPAGLVAACSFTGSSTARRSRRASRECAPPCCCATATPTRSCRRRACRRVPPSSATGARWSLLQFGGVRHGFTNPAQALNPAAESFGYERRRRRRRGPPQWRCWGGVLKKLLAEPPLRPRRRSGVRCARKIEARNPTAREWRYQMKQWLPQRLPGRRQYPQTAAEMRVQPCSRPPHNQSRRRNWQPPNFLRHNHSASGLRIMRRRPRTTPVRRACQSRKWGRRRRPLRAARLCPRSSVQPRRRRCRRRSSTIRRRRSRCRCRRQQYYPPPPVTLQQSPAAAAPAAAGVPPAAAACAALASGAGQQAAGLEQVKMTAPAQLDFGAAARAGARARRGDRPMQTRYSAGTITFTQSMQRLITLVGKPIVMAAVCALSGTPSNSASQPAAAAAARRRCLPAPGGRRARIGRSCGQRAARGAAEPSPPSYRGLSAGGGKRPQMGADDSRWLHAAEAARGAAPDGARAQVAEIMAHHEAARATRRERAGRGQGRARPCSMRARRRRRAAAGAARAAEVEPPPPLRRRTAGLRGGRRTAGRWRLKPGSDDEGSQADGSRPTAANRAAQSSDDDGGAGAAVVPEPRSRRRADARAKRRRRAVGGGDAHASGGDVPTPRYIRPLVRAAHQLRAVAAAAFGAAGGEWRRQGGTGRRAGRRAWEGAAAPEESGGGAAAASNGRGNGPAGAAAVDGGGQASRRTRACATRCGSLCSSCSPAPNFLRAWTVCGR